MRACRKLTHQHCGEQHLHRYLAEFEFRHNNRAAHGCNDSDRSVAALSGIVCKRLTYAIPDLAEQAAGAAVASRL